MPGVLYTLNDSDNPPIVFAFDSSGRPQGRWQVPGVRNRDWEAIAVGPCPLGSCLYIGDIGDNTEHEPAVVVYRVREPTSLRAFREVAGLGPPDLDSLVLRYPDGPHDAEAMWIDGAGGVFVVTKGRTGGVKLFHAPQSGFGERAPTVARFVQDLPVPGAHGWGLGVTDAALAPDGKRVVVRTYTELYIFPVLPGGRLGAPIERCNIAGLEPQGEGVEWLDDRRLVLTSESGPGNLPGAIHLTRCGP